MANMAIEELYLFTEGNIRTGFTSGVTSTTLSSITYTPLTIKRGGIQLSQNSTKSSLNIEIPRTSPLGLNWLQGLPSATIYVDIYRNTNPYWRGKVQGIKADKDTITLECVSLYASRIRQGIFANVSLTCRHSLYGGGCGLVASSFQTIVPVSGITGTDITILGLALPDKYLTGGYATINGISRSIKHQIATLVQLVSPFPGSQTGDLYLFPGCDLQEATCKNKFNNILNFGGFSHIPKKNPFGSGGLY